MAIEQHIEELRAELSACGSRVERRKIERELKDATARLAVQLRPD
ncbi:hypothetical protein [Novosphingobium terrae]|nr:hypothetical protein [Novosphingobium terrae]